MGVPPRKSWACQINTSPGLARKLTGSMFFSVALVAYNCKTPVAQRLLHWFFGVKTDKAESDGCPGNSAADRSQVIFFLLQSM